MKKLTTMFQILDMSHNEILNYIQYLEESNNALKTQVKTRNKTIKELKGGSNAND